MKRTDNNDVLSRLMDGEWGDLDATRCVADVCKSKDMQDKWARYHLARDVMRSEVVDPSMSIAAGVSAALADEPAYSNIASIDSSVNSNDVSNDNVGTAPIHKTATSSEVKAQSRWGMGVAGFGIAASAALATVFSMDYLQGQNTVNLQSLVAGVNAPVASPVQTSPVQALPSLVNQGGNGSPIELVSNRGSYWVSGQDGQRVDSEARMNQFLGDHIEQTTVNDWRGMMPYSRLVGYDANQAASEAASEAAREAAREAASEAASQ